MEAIRELAEIYPQLYLDPDKTDLEAYTDVVLKGQKPDTEDLSHFITDPEDKIESMKTPGGTAKVVTIHNRHDFEIFIRCMMAVKDGPEREVPATMGASTLTTFNWPRIYAHRSKFMKEQLAAGNIDPDWAAEFARFREVKENYIDMFIVLSCGPYSNVSAEAASEALDMELDEKEWEGMSSDVRKYHELTHFVCRNLYPEKIDAIWDELVADAAGIYGALGRYDRRLEELFLGIKEGRYTGGRLENYTDEGADLDAMAVSIDGVLREFEKAYENGSFEDVYAFMLTLEDMYETLGKVL